MTDRFQTELQKIKKRHERRQKKKNSQKTTANSKFYSKQQAINKIYSQLVSNAHLPRRFRSCTFDNFDMDFIPENREKVRAIKNYASNIHQALERNQSILIYSQKKGCGKTHIAVAAAKVAIKQFARKLFARNRLKYLKRGVMDNFLKTYAPVYFFSEQSFIWKKKKFNTNNQAIKDEVERIETAIIESPLVIIDDLFKARDTDFTFDEMTNWLCERYNQNKAVILTTNTNFRQLKEESQENPFRHRLNDAQFLYSRIEEMTKGFQFMFADYRDYREESR